MLSLLEQVDLHVTQRLLQLHDLFFPLPQFPLHAVLKTNSVLVEN
jgi:hypothetical protein